MADSGKLGKSFRPRIYYGHPLRVFLLAIKTVAFVHVVTKYCYSVRGTEGPSMLPTLEVKNDFVLLSKRHRRGRNIVVGDIISFTHPTLPGEGAIKRVIGMPGDFVLRDTPDSGNDIMLQV
jgi:inner membrane protease subunit 1